uniref:SAP domain-containing protein n=1 Tax=Lepeophtheirus salmonis TaxID=72036 RepID=A0A0K2TLY0_LEPSM
MELMTELVKRGARTHGKKLLLIERLQFYDSNDDFRRSVVQIPDLIPMLNW